MDPSHCEYNLLAVNLSIRENRVEWEGESGGQVGDQMEGLRWSPQGVRGKQEGAQTGGGQVTSAGGCRPDLCPRWEKHRTLGR